MSPTTTHRHSWGISHGPKPCALHHHQPGSKVCFTIGLQKFTGVVQSHNPDRRAILVRTLHHSQEIAMSCGGVGKP